MQTDRDVVQQSRFNMQRLDQFPYFGKSLSRIGPQPHGKDPQRNWEVIRRCQHKRRDSSKLGGCLRWQPNKWEDWSGEEKRRAASLEADVSGLVGGGHVGRREGAKAGTWYGICEIVRSCLPFWALRAQCIM